ncbi:MAG: hypothetical protein EBZ77_13120 [Chitinophagia bacterium]|nr:hypothetical protein [Chitinophagia bacterium]
MDILYVVEPEEPEPVVAAILLLCSITWKLLETAYEWVPEGAVMLPPSCAEELPAPDASTQLA